MMHALRIARSKKLPRLAAVVLAIASLGLAGCDENGGDPKGQIGADPALVDSAHHVIGAPSGRFLRISQPRRP